MKLSDVKSNNIQWFSKGNKSFFNDISYRLLRDFTSKEKDYMLVQETYGFSEKVHYRIRPIDSKTLKLGSLCKQSFNSIDSVKDFLRK